MKCPNCGNENPQTLRFCEQCGAPLAEAKPESTQACPVCGAQNRPSAKFCARCRARLIEAGPTPSPAQVRCPKCGVQNRPGAKFCARCRARLLEAGPTPAPAQVRCPKCGTLNRPGAKFCARCRARLIEAGPTSSPAQVRCPKCGTQNPPTLRFCEQCGAPLAVPQQAIPLRRPRKRRRILVTVALLAAPLLVVALFAWPILRGDQLMRLPGTGDLSNITEEEAVTLSLSIIEDTYPQLVDDEPVVRQSGTADEPVYEVTFATSLALEGGGDYPWNVTVIVDSANDKIAVIESN